MTFLKQKTEVIYPESDGKRIAENTLQYEWIEKIKGGVEAVFASAPEVFVAGDLLWYPVEGKNTLCTAPDTMVAFGRPKGYRGSYKQWEEDNIPPQVVFEVLSPSNSAGEMVEKAFFYDRYGVEEYYLYNPHNADFAGWERSAATGHLEPIAATQINGWVSARLGVRFDTSGFELVIYRPDGEPFKSYVQLVADRQQAEQRAIQEQMRAEQEQARANQEQARANQEQARAERAEDRAARLAARLSELGVDPDAL